MFSFPTTLINIFRMQHIILDKLLGTQESRLWLIIIVKLQKTSLFSQEVIYLTITYLCLFVVEGWDPRLLSQYSYSSCWVQDGPSDRRLHTDGAVQSETNPHHSWAGTAKRSHIFLFTLSFSVKHCRLLVYLKALLYIYII